MPAYHDEYGFRTFVLTFQARDLPSMDLFSPSDGFVVLFEKNNTNVDQAANKKTHPSDQEWIRIGCTEVIMDAPSPFWTKSISVEVNQEGITNGEFKAVVYDADEADLNDLSSQDIIGSALFSLTSFGPETTGTIHLGLEDKGKPVVSKNNPPARLTITSTEYPTHSRKACVTLDVTYPKDPHLETMVQFVQVTQESNQQYTHPSLLLEREIVVYQSPSASTNYPIFEINEDQLYHVTTSQTQQDTTPVVNDNPAFTILSEEVVETQTSKQFEIRLLQYKDSMHTKLLGTTRLPATHQSLSTTNNSTVSNHIVKLNDPSLKKKNEQIGSVNIRNWRSNAHCPSYKDFVDSGLKFKLDFAIDCSGSGNRHAAGLHSLNAENQNQFTWCISDLASSLIEMLGQDCVSELRSFAFGGPATDPLNINPSERFALGLTNTKVEKPSDIIDQYTAFTKVPFPQSQPNRTNFAPFLRFYNESKVVVKENILKVTEANGIQVSDPTYNVLVILTDGEIADMKETLQAVFDLSLKPVSIIFVGIGPDGNHKYKDLDPFNTALRGEGLLRVDKSLHVARHLTYSFPYLFFVKSLEYLKIKLFRTIQQQVVQQFFLANKFPVRKFKK